MTPTRIQDRPKTQRPLHPTPPPTPSPGNLGVRLGEPPGARCPARFLRGGKNPSRQAYKTEVPLSPEARPTNKALPSNAAARTVAAAASQTQKAARAHCEPHSESATSFSEASYWAC